MALRKGNFRGIHTVYSHFNDAFREYFGTDPVEAINRLVEEGKIVRRPSRGGVTIYLPEEAPQGFSLEKKKSGILEKILGS